jgi:hypothetical protein
VPSPNRQLVVAVGFSVNQFPVHSFSHHGRVNAPSYLFSPRLRYVRRCPLFQLGISSCPLILFLFIVSETPRKNHQFVAQRTSHWKRRILLRFGLHSSSLFIYTHTHPTF